MNFGVRLLSPPSRARASTRRPLLGAVEGRAETYSAMKFSLPRLRQKSNLLNLFNLILSVQSHLEKFSALPVGQIISTSPRHPVSPEGRLAIVTDVETGCGGREGAERRTAPLPGEAFWRRRVARTAKSCGPDAPMLASTRGNACALRGDGDNKPGSPGRARRKPLKPLRGECRPFRCDRGD